MAERDEQQNPAEEPTEGAAGEQGEAPLEEQDEAHLEEQGEAHLEEHPEALLEDLRAKADENWNHYLRAHAEMENLRQRYEKELGKARKYALEKFANELLPVIDSLEMGLASIPADDGGSDVAAKTREGMELTLKQLQSALEKFGIEPVEPAIGDPLDPERHQAMSTQESSEVAPNGVTAVMQKGYLLNDRLLRPAMVMVAKAPAES
ncbi:MAG: nucleotide exchange factor GrpE [Thiohalospira sp.]